jgi:NAD(P)-dependent dehydrogenase (short-subunit alcohol dehydrogenase family)
MSTLPEAPLAYRHEKPLDWYAKRLDGRVTLVTGASSGIGAAAVRLFAKEGAIVVAAARRRERIEALAKALCDEGLKASALVMDVREEASVEAAIAEIVKTHGRLDCAFNNAGVGGQHRPLVEMSTRGFDAVIATNLRGVFLCLKHEIAAMLKNADGGAIVNTSSIGGLVGGAMNTDYAASKWGLTGLTKCVALEFAARNIRVNAIAPGPTRSEMFDRWMSTEAMREELAARIPMNYVAEPDDMARAALFLLSQESRWTTGAILPCEGGAAAD